MKRRSNSMMAALAAAAFLVAAPTLRAQSFADFVRSAAASSVRAPVNTWTPVGPTAATILSMARDPSNPSLIYAGAHFGGLYRSIDGGLTWTHIPTAFSGEGVTDIEILPTTPRTIFVATLDTGVQRSTDGGATWVNRADGLTDKAIRDIAVDPRNPSHLLAGSFGGVHVSDDSGDTWRLATSDAEFLPGVHLVFDPVEPGVAFAGSQGLGVFRSDDGGASWAKFSDGMGDRDITSIAFDPTDPDALYAASPSAVFRLTRGETTWEVLTFDLPSAARVAQITRIPGQAGVFVATDAGVFQLADIPPAGAAATVDPAPSWTLWSDEPTRLLYSNPTGSRVHLAGFFNTFFETEDGGATLRSAASGIQNAFIGALAAINMNAETALFAGAGDDVQVTKPSFNPGGVAVWRSAVQIGGAVFELAADPSNSATIYAGSEAGGVRATRDGGGTWKDESTGITPQDVVAIDQDRAGGGTIYAGTAAGVFVSFDEGLTWKQKFQAQNPARITDVEADPILPNFAYYANDGGQFFRTEDGGDHFAPFWRSPAGVHIVDLESAPFADLYAVGSDGALYTSSDHGDNFFRRGARSIRHHALTVLVDEQRPWISYVGTVFGGVYRSRNSAQTWSRHSRGMDVPIIFSLAMDPEDDAILYAGAIGRVYRSVNGARSWRRVGQGLPERGVVAKLKVDPVNPSRLLAWITGDRIDPTERGLYRSLDSGDTWSRFDATGGFVATGGLLLSRTTPGAVFAGSHERGVFFSSDQGATWTNRSQDMSAITLGLAIDRANSQTVYAGTVTSGVFRSDDAGAHWTSKGLQGVSVFNMTADPGSAGVVYAASALGVMRSLDWGETWGIAGQRVPFALDIAVDPTTPGRVFVAGVGGGVFRSDDAGQTWMPASNGLPLLDVQAIAIDPSDGAIYAALERDGVYRSADAGQTWSKISLKSLPYQFLDLEIDPVYGDMYLATNLRGALRSRDHGATWRRASRGLRSRFVADIAVRPDARGRTTLFAAVLNDTSRRIQSRRVRPAVYRSMNRGQRWRRASDGLDEAGARALAVSRAPLGPIFAADADGVHRSDDLGESWTLLAAPFALGRIDALALDESEDLLYATGEKGVFVLDLSTQTWESPGLPPLGEDAVGVAVATGPGGAAFVATADDGVLMTEDFGQTWTGGMDRDLAFMTPHAVAVHPDDPNILYAALQAQGVARSDDRGKTWRFINNGLDARRMFTITIDPTNPSTIYATSNEAGVWVSDDGGANWSSLNSGLFNHFVTAFAIDPINPRVVYAGTEGGGVFRLERP